MARKVRFSPDSSAPLSRSAILGCLVPPEAATTDKKQSSGTHQVKKKWLRRTVWGFQCLLGGNTPLSATLTADADLLLSSQCRQVSAVRLWKRSRSQCSLGGSGAERASSKQRQCRAGCRLQSTLSGGLHQNLTWNPHPH
ncbi:hypothetical protein CesoFtcFv8_005060 [Champsocephalus esox]|uniref:Uncharacterized protein n=1 Tax=Champsocephalus esox TaxID=159716 RepID=A0AAN8CUB4_9TELE|nr:hypothetical protein CesoFtcFv8_005060 [Champsocephalus esox]